MSQSSGGARRRPALPVTVSWRRRCPRLGRCEAQEANPAALRGVRSPSRGMSSGIEWTVCLYNALLLAAEDRKALFAENLLAAHVQGAGHSQRALGRVTSSSQAELPAVHGSGGL